MKMYEKKAKKPKGRNIPLLLSFIGVYIRRVKYLSVFYTPLLKRNGK